MGQEYFKKRRKKTIMKYFKRKDGSVFGKVNPDKKMLDDFKKKNYVPCDENGKVIKEKKVAKKSSKR